MQEEDVARLFVALWPDATVRARLAGQRDAWRWPPGARPVADADLHLTLHFIGAFARPRVAELDRSLAALERESMTLSALGAEVWKGGIAVLRLAGEPALLALHAGIGAVLTRMGVPLDARPFSPHVTLARRARGAEPPGEPTAFEWRAGGFALVESRPGGRPRYAVVRAFG